MLSPRMLILTTMACLGASSAAAGVGTIMVSYYTPHNFNNLGVLDGPTFAIQNTSSVALTNGVLYIGANSTTPADSFAVGTIPPNSAVYVMPGASNDGGSNHTFFKYTGSIRDTSDEGPDENTVPFVFTASWNGTPVTTGTFTPGPSAGPSNDGTVKFINFLGGPNNADAPCNDCFGPKLAATIATVPSDFNHDGHPDVIWEAPTSGFAQLWLLGGAQGVTVMGAADLTQTNPWHIVAVADFNGDGAPDVVWQDPVSGAVQVWFMGGSEGNMFISAANITNANSWQVVSVADFNSDGHPDLLWEDPKSGFSQIWYMGGSQGITFLSAADLTQTNPWHIVGTGDFNLDGFPDVLWQDPVNGTVQIWYMGGTTPGQQGSQLQTAVNLPANKWHVMAIADFNQDGHPDIVYESPTTNAAQVFYYTGAQGTTPAGSAVLSGANPWYLAGPH
ncbi:MAG: VCBS repeat-containing protein [Bryobacteraceae bacterium]